MKRVKPGVQISKHNWNKSKIVSEYDQEIPQSQTADNAVAPRGRSALPSRDTRNPTSSFQSKSS